MSLGGDGHQWQEPLKFLVDKWETRQERLADLFAIKAADFLGIVKQNKNRRLRPEFVEGFENSFSAAILGEVVVDEGDFHDEVHKVYKVRKVHQVVNNGDFKDFMDL